jgi:hypothetical protein
MDGMPVLNPALDLGRAAAAFKQDGRVHIRSFLTQESAARLHQCLSRETDFSLFSRAGDGPAQVWPVAKLTPGKEAELMGAAYAGAQGGVRYLHDGHILSRGGEAYPDPSHYLSAVAAFLNSAPFLDFARALTGDDAITFAGAQATRYRPGHFFDRHDGGQEGAAAYVLNMTPRWRPDWGGGLLFSDQPGHLSGGYLPAFNTLNILKVPQEHLVGLVAPFAGAARYAITGWLGTR